MGENQTDNTTKESGSAPPSPDVQGKVGGSSTETNLRGEVSATSHSGKSLNNIFFYVYRQFVFPSSKTAREYMAKKLPLVIPSVILTLLGFKQLPQSIPLLNFIKDHRVVSPIIGTILVLLFVAAMIISFLPPPKSVKDENPSKQNTVWHIQPWVIATVMSTTSFILSLVLLIIVLIRPAWCPNVLCIASQPLIYGPHDAHLEVNFIAVQSPTYVLAKNPSQYSLGSKDLPESTEPNSIGAMRIDAKTTSSPYYIVLNIHNLDSQGYSMLIENVDLVVKQTPSIPFPLNALSQPLSTTYQSVNLYSFAYRGEAANAVLPGFYVRLPGGNAELKPLETDSLILQVIPHLLVAEALRFNIQITYRFANEAQRFTFTFPYTFEAIFAKVSNWNAYQFQGGRLVKVNE